MSYKRWIFVAIFLFGIGLVFGLTIALTLPASPVEITLQDIPGLKELVDFLASLPPALTAILIFTKNASALVLSFALSPGLCLVPAFALFSNGSILGLISVMAGQEKSLGFVLAGLLPHGIFELPALILGEAAALNFGAVVILALFKKERRSLLLPSLKQNLRYLVLALILLLPAAIIETYVTPLLLT